MSAIDDFKRELEEELIDNYGESIPGTRCEGTLHEFALKDPKTYEAFTRLMELVRKDDSNFEEFQEEWLDYQLESPELSVQELAEEYGSGYFDGFQGGSLRELYDFQYSPQLEAIKAQGWTHDETITSESGIVARLFSHSSYLEHDSWAFLEDTESGEVRHFSFSWV